MRKSLWAVAATSLLPITGCGSVDRQVDEAKATPLAAVAARNRAAESAVAAATADNAAPEASREAPTEAQRYEPPFPDRQDPFQAPRESSRTARRSEGESSGLVELLGFAKLDEPSAVLSIDGEVRVIAQGETASGVEVVKIAPPRAVLKRGRTRWTATIE